MIRYHPLTKRCAEYEYSLQSNRSGNSPSPEPAEPDQLKDSLARRDQRSGLTFETGHEPTQHISPLALQRLDHRHQLREPICSRQRIIAEGELTLDHEWMECRLLQIIVDAERRVIQEGSEIRLMLELTPHYPIKLLRDLDLLKALESYSVLCSEQSLVIEISLGGE